MMKERRSPKSAKTTKADAVPSFPLAKSESASVRQPPDWKPPENKTKMSVFTDPRNVIMFSPLSLVDERCAHPGLNILSGQNGPL
jgi:hypothetical protein